MCWHPGVTSGFHEGLSRLRAAKFSTEGIRGNLLIREKRLNLRSCDCKWRWGLSGGLSVSLQGKCKQASKQWQFITHTCTSLPQTHVNTSTHDTHSQPSWYYSNRLFLIMLINCIIGSAKPLCQSNNNTADKWKGFFNTSHDFTGALRGLASLLIHAAWLDVHHKI